MLTAGAAPICSRPAPPLRTSSTACRPRSTADSACSACGRKARPASVRRLPWRLRMSSSTPRSRSSVWRRAVTAGWVTNSDSAAWEMDPVRATWTNASRRPRSIGSRLGERVVSVMLMTIISKIVLPYGTLPAMVVGMLNHIVSAQAIGPAARPTLCLRWLASLRDPSERLAELAPEAPAAAAGPERGRARRVHLPRPLRPRPRQRVAKS